MTGPTTVTIEVPAGWRIRDIKTCPIWCVATEDDHIAHGDHTHYGACLAVDDRPVDQDNLPIDAWLVSQDGGEVEIEFGPYSSGNWRWSPQQVQEFMAYLSSLLHAIGEQSPGDSARAAQAAAAMTLRGLLLAEKFHPAVALTIQGVIGVLDARGNTRYLVDEDALHEWMTLGARIDVVKDSMRVETDLDKQGELMAEAVALTKARDALLPDGLAAVVRARG